MAILRQIRSKTPEYLYRVEMPTTYDFDEVTGEYTSPFEIKMVKVAVAYRTPFGLRLVCGKMVYLNSKKKYADFTEADAWRSFYARKLSEEAHIKRRQEMLKARLLAVREMREIARAELDALMTPKTPQSLTDTSS